jgi:hypothetical protein
MQNSFFFACGTPSDREGFTYKCLNESSLPGSPASYLDRITDIGPEGVFTVDLISIDKRSFALFTEYRAIQPSDKDYNRGAYIAAGFLSPPETGIHCLSNNIALTNEIIGALVSKLDSRGAFPKGFKLEEFTHPISGSYIENLSPFLLADLVFQASNRQGSFNNESGRIVLSPSDTNLNAMLESLSFYTRPDNDRLIEGYRADASSAIKLAKEAAKRAAAAEKQLEKHSIIVQDMKEDLARFKDEKAKLEMAERINNTKGAELEERLRNYSDAPETVGPMTYDSSSQLDKPTYRLDASLEPRRIVDSRIAPAMNTGGPAQSERSAPVRRKKPKSASKHKVERESGHRKLDKRWIDWTIAALLVIIVALLAYYYFLHESAIEKPHKIEVYETLEPLNGDNEGNGEAAEGKNKETDVVKQRLKTIDKNR